MKPLRFFLPASITALLIAGLFVSCGKKGPTIEQRIQALTEKGVPDSVLANVKVYLYQVNSAKKMSQAGIARTYGDSLKKGIVIAEQWYEKAMTENKPVIDNLRKSFVERKAGLSGLHLKDADSLLKIADSLIAKDWLVQARTKLESFDTIMGILVRNQAKAEEIRKQITGTWRDTHILEAPEDIGMKFSAKDIRMFKFNDDGSFEASEERHGQTTPFLKEDWKFLSWGTFDLMGDTIYQFINREKCTQQWYTQKNVKLNKWERKEHPTYDSTITNGKKDRFIVFSDLKLEFKKGK